MFLSRWLDCLGAQVRNAHRNTTTNNYFHPHLEALEAREVPTVSTGATLWMPGPPPVVQLLASTAVAPFSAAADGSAPLTVQQARTAAFTSKQPSVFVQNGQSIQAALDAAKAGTTIYLAPGTYQQSLSVNTANIQIVGLVGADGSHVVLTNPGTGGNAVSVDANANGFGMRFVEVRGFTGDAVHLDHVQNFNLTHLLLVGNGGSGIATAYSGNGTIQYTQDSGNHKAGFDLEEANNVTVRYNQSFSNVVGAEVVNSTGVNVLRNSFFDNTAGIVVALLPGATGSNNLLAENYVSANNHVNFATPGSAEASLVPGTGILLYGANGTQVLGNLVTGNATLGIGVVSAGGAFQGYGATPPVVMSASQPAQNNQIAYNWAVGNGFNSMTPQLPKGADLVSDGLGQGNVWNNNTFGTKNW